jgi:hypothetical protein
LSCRGRPLRWRASWRIDSRQLNAGGSISKHLALNHHWGRGLRRARYGDLKAAVSAGLSPLGALAPPKTGTQASRWRRMTASFAETVPRICARQIWTRGLLMIGKNSQDITVERIPAQRRRNLLILRAGAEPRPSFFFSLPNPRNFDIFVSYYSGPSKNDILVAQADGIYTGGLSKFHSVHELARVYPDITDYEHILVADEDLDFRFSLDDFFTFCSVQGFDLAQASLTRDSYVSFALTRHNPGLSFRITNFVEVMAPCFSRRYFSKMLHSFNYSISGWGLDVYWGHHLGNEYVAAIVDDFQMRHCHPFEPNGDFYLYLRSIGIDNHQELQAMLGRLGLNRYDPVSLKLVHASGANSRAVS